MYHGLLFFINVSGLNLKAIFTALVKVRKKGFCIVLAAKEQKCRVRVPLSKCARARSFVQFSPASRTQKLSAEPILVVVSPKYSLVERPN